MSRCQAGTVVPSEGAVAGADEFDLLQGGAVEDGKFGARSAHGQDLLIVIGGR